MEKCHQLQFFFSLLIYFFFSICMNIGYFIESLSSKPFVKSSLVMLFYTKKEKTLENKLILT